MAARNSYDLAKQMRTVSSNLAQGLYTTGRPEHSLIPCDVLGGTILAPNHQAGLKKSGSRFSSAQTLNMGRTGLIRLIMNVSTVGP